MSFNQIFKKDMFNKDKNDLGRLFCEDAECVVEALRDRKQGVIKTTQYRKFYDRVIELNDMAQNSSEDFKTVIYPALKILIPKAQYSKNRKLAGDNFVTFMQESINNINKDNGKVELQNFKYFMEAILGFMPKN